MVVSNKVSVNPRTLNWMEEAVLFCFSVMASSGELDCCKFPSIKVCQCSSKVFPAEVGGKDVNLVHFEGLNVYPMTVLSHHHHMVGCNAILCFHVTDDDISSSSCSQGLA